MNCERVKELSVDYLLEELEDSPRSEVEAHLAECPRCLEEFGSSLALWTKLSTLPAPEPSPAMDARFHAMLASARRRLEAERPDSQGANLVQWLAWLWPRRPALQFGLGVLLFGVGLLLGTSVTLSRRVGPQAATTQERTLTQLRQEVSGLKEMVSLALLQQASASERLRGVEWSSQLAAPDERVLTALLRALDSDPNVNVRLAAVDALQRYGDRAAVKQGLLGSLPRQESPLVQVELIRLLVELKEKESVPALKTLLQDSALNPTVRQCAEWGLEQLRSRQESASHGTQRRLRQNC
jgi:anti-sigma factor RsiW